MPEVAVATVPASSAVRKATSLVSVRKVVAERAADVPVSSATKRATWPATVQTTNKVEAAAVEATSANALITTTTSAVAVAGRLKTGTTTSLPAVIRNGRTPALRKPTGGAQLVFPTKAVRKHAAGEPVKTPLTR